MKNISPRRLLLLGLALVAPMLLIMALGAKNAPEPSWPVLAQQTAEEVSLSKAWDMLNEPLPGRRAAVVNTELVIETPLSSYGETGRVIEDLDDAGDPVKDGPPGLDPDGNLVHHYAQLPYPPSRFITAMAQEAEVDVQIVEPLKTQPSWIDRVIAIAPALLLIGLLILFFSRGATKSLGLNSAFQVVATDDLKESFDDVAGMGSARDELEEIVTFLKDPKKASRLGGRMPKGALFDGPPGTGKTLLARALAKEAGVPFLTIEASGVNQLFVGAGSMKIRRAFKEARKHAPCIIFIDEIDAMGKARGGASSGAGDEKETTLNALLVELDGFDARDGVFLVAATNRPEVLDPALTRRGRIDRRITVDLPDLEARKEVLKVHCRKIKAVVGLDIDTIAQTTFGFSGADLAALVNEAALVATRAEREYVELADFEAARDRLVVGLSGRQRRLSEADRELTAVHEAGHALIAALNPNADPIEKATILPQGRAAGYVMQAPTEDRSFETQDRLLARIEVAVAGREAERLVFGEGAITTGAASDIQQATSAARAMVTRFGMSQQGFLHIDPNDPMLIDPQNPPVREISRLVGEAQARVAQKLEEKRERLDALAEALMASETLLGAEVMRIAHA